MKGLTLMLEIKKDYKIQFFVLMLLATGQGK
jgi:hypothetical protein